MSYQELFSEIKQLPLDEQLLLLENLTHSLREELVPITPKKSSLERVRGMLKPDKPVPADADFKDEYVEYLMEKYA